MHSLWYANKRLCVLFVSAGFCFGAQLRVSGVLLVFTQMCRFELTDVFLGLLRRPDLIFFFLCVPVHFPVTVFKSSPARSNRCQIVLLWFLMCFGAFDSFEQLEIKCVFRCKLMHDQFFKHVPPSVTGCPTPRDRL